MLNNEVISGVRIGDFFIGEEADVIKKKLGSIVEIEKRNQSIKLKTQNMSFWVDDKNDKVFQIGVKENFKGKFLGKIGIGSTLSDIGKYIGEWKEEFDVYVLPRYPGICFELKDVDDYDEEWNELKMPINAIYIYDEKYFKSK